MKRKIYTKSADIELLKKVDNDGGLFTAEEHAYVAKRQYGDTTESKEMLLRRFLSEDAAKLSALGFLIKYIYDYRLSNVLSLGAGTCVPEYLLKIALPADSKVVATDFDPFLIKRAKIMSPDIIPIEFDFSKDSIAELQATLDTNFDIAVLFGSSYIMDDEIFVKLFGQLKDTRIKHIIDFQAGYMNNRVVIQNIFTDFLVFLYKTSSRIAPSMTKTIASKIIGRVPFEEYRGKFHGYCRSRGELRKLYKKAGIRPVKEMKISPYEYVVIFQLAS